MRRVRLLITGIVQGVGFRPFVWRRATRLALSGFVENTAAGVVIEIEGPAEAVAAFADGLAAAAPPLANVEGISEADIPPIGAGAKEPFRILHGVATDGPRTLVSADIATCEACLAEMRDPSNRRHGHPFVTCTDCGPRYTIIERLPYDRPATTMGGFLMCPACAAEYADPADRRFHAQPIACPACGPVVWFTTAADANTSTATDTITTGTPTVTDRPASPPVAAEAIAAARQLLHRGGILAVKNLGGFHLACDATSDRAVALLRGRKHRPTKPFAVMAADLAAAERLAQIDEQAARLLTGPERPIVLVPKRPGPGLADAVAPGNDFIGIILPAAPLQHRLAEGLPPLVMTSGNLAGEPIATDNTEALERLGRIADGFLLHDRGIHVPCDDSVVRCVVGAPLPIRRGRGQAPVPIRLAGDGPTILAVGGELKAALCLATGTRAIMSQHLGDVGNLATLQAIQQAADHMLGLFSVEPVAIAADLHPGYLSTEWAARFAAAHGIPLVRVQHHEAHVASLLAEHVGVPMPPAAASVCLVACFDGTGYWPDDSIAGGEFFVADSAGIRRVAHLAPFPLPGGDAAIRHPWRTAVALLHAAGLPWDERLPASQAASDTERRLLRQQLDRGLACTPTTSMGRLFDGVAALLGGPTSITFEAEAALWLESQAAACPADRATRLDFAIATEMSDGPLAADWRPLIAAVVAQVLAGKSPASIAAGFHEAVVRLIVAMQARLGSGPGGPVGLTGGVFQNARLVELAATHLQAAGCEPLLHHAVPPNDGGLALGQAVLARQRLTRG